MRRLASSLVFGTFLASTASAKDWHVDDDAAPGGDGSANRPFQTVAAGLTAAADGDRILVAAGTYLEYLVVDKSVTILGDRDGGTNLTAHSTSVLTIGSTATVWLQDLDISDGSWQIGGGISNAGTTTAVRCRIRDCTAFAFSDDAAGGGVNNRGTLVMWSCTIEDCQTFTQWAWPFGLHVGIAFGGGISNSGTLELYNTTLARNVATTDVLLIDDPARGGAIHSTGDVRLVNCTITGNQVHSRATFGGGIDVEAGNVTIEHSTIAGNLAEGSWPDNPGMGTASGGGVNGIALVTHSVIADNEVHDDNLDANSTGPDFAGTCDSLGYLLIEDDSGTTIVGDPTGVQTDVDPLLQPLADNGGSVATQALDPASPCVDAGNLDPFASPAYDARDFPRALWDPAVGPCDLGAYEYGAVVSFRLTATPDLPLPPGAVAALTVGGGIHGHPTVLVVVDVCGSPTFFPIVITAFDPSGTFTLEDTVPPGLSGLTAGLRDYSLDAAGKLVITNLVTLVFA